MITTYLSRFSESDDTLMCPHPFLEDVHTYTDAVDMGLIFHPSHLLRTPGSKTTKSRKRPPSDSDAKIKTKNLSGPAAKHRPAISKPVKEKDGEGKHVKRNEEGDKPAKNQSKHKTDHAKSSKQERSSANNFKKKQDSTKSSMRSNQEPETGSSRKSERRRELSEQAMRSIESR